MSSSAPPEPLVFFTDRDLGNQFPDILRAAGLTVHRHSELFEPTCPDDEWLAHVGGNGWIAITHDRRIRYKANERDAVIAHGVRLLVVIGKMPLGLLAANFVATLARIETFVANHPAPWIAKVYRPSPSAPNGSPGSVALWIPAP